MTRSSPSVALPVLFAFASMLTAQSRPTGWVRGFLEKVPADACVVAVLDTPIAEFGKEVLGALGPRLEPEFDDLVRLGKAAGSAKELVAQLAAPLQDRCAVVMREGRRDPEIPVHDPRPVPHWACVFWPRLGAAPDSWRALAKAMKDNRGAFGLQIFKLAAGPGQKADEIIEFWNPWIPGTGELALWFGPQVVAVSNSGALLRDLAGPRDKGKGILERFDRVSLEDPAGGNGSLLFVPQGVAALLAAREKWIRSLLEQPQRRREESRERNATPAGAQPDSRPDLTTQRAPEVWPREPAEHLPPALVLARELRDVLELFPGAQGQVQIDKSAVGKLLGRLIGE
jgi:hypothetical protein